MTIELSSVVGRGLRVMRQPLCLLARWFAAAMAGALISGGAVDVGFIALVGVFSATATAPVRAQQKYVLSPARKVTDTPSAERPDIQDVALSPVLGRSVRLFEISTGIWAYPCKDLFSQITSGKALPASSQACETAEVQARLDDYRELVRIVATTAVGRRMLNAIAIARPLPDPDGTFKTRILNGNTNYGRVLSASGQVLRVNIVITPPDESLIPTLSATWGESLLGYGVIGFLGIDPRIFWVREVKVGPVVRSAPELTFFHELTHGLHYLLGEHNYGASDPPAGVRVPITSLASNDKANWYTSEREEIYTVGNPVSARYLDSQDPSGVRSARAKAKVVRDQLRVRFAGKPEILQDIAANQAASDATSGPDSADGLSGEVNEMQLGAALSLHGRNRYSIRSDVLHFYRFTLPVAQLTPADLNDQKPPRVVLFYVPGNLCPKQSAWCPTGDEVPASAVPAEDWARLEATEAAPRDPLAGQQRYLASTANGGLGIASAWAAGWTGKGQRVAILGTGYRFHPDLPTPGANGESWMGDARAAGQWDAVDRDWDATDPGCVGSAWDFTGMKFAGIVGAYRSGTGDTPGQVARAGAQGGVGVAPDAELVYVRAMPACGGINRQALVDGLAYASGAPAAGPVPLNSDPAGTILLAVGPLEKASCPSDIQVAIDAAVGRGSVVVAPAGNFDADIKDYWPANCANVLMVLAGSLSKAGSLFTASNDMRSIWTSGPGAAVVVGPGEPVLTTSFSHDAAQASTPVYDSVSLTYEAAAVVAGVTALVRQAEPGLLSAGARTASAKAAATTSYSHGSTLSCAQCGSGWLTPLAAISQAAEQPGGGRLVSWMNGATVSIDTELPSHRVLAPDSVAGTNLVTLRNVSEMTKGEEHWKFQLQPNGGFHIINAVDSRCLDVVPNERSRTTKLALAFAPCSSEASQLWAPQYLGVSKANGGYDHFVYRIAHARDDLCLYPVDGDVNNTPIALSTCVNQDASAAWNIYLDNNRAAPSSPVFPANSVISNYGYGRVLTAPEAIGEPVRLGARAAVGARAVDVASQQWRFVTIPGGSGTTGQFVNAQTNWCLGAHASAETPNPFVTVIQEPCSETATTLLGLTMSYGSRYVIQWASYTPLVFSADGDSVGTRRYVVNPTQLWSFAK